MRGVSRIHKGGPLPLPYLFTPSLPLLSFLITHPPMPISHHFHGCTALLVLRFVVVQWRYIKYLALPFYLPSPSLFYPASTPFLSPFLRSIGPLIQLKGLGSAADRCPSGSGRNPAVKRYLVHFGLKNTSGKQF